MEWIYTATADQDKVAPCRTIDVCVDEFGEYWTGSTIYRDMKDYEFHPREQHGTGETGLRIAKAAAETWANGIAADERWMARR